MAPPTIYLDDEHKIIVRNDDGDWTVRKKHAPGTDGAGPGPGYVARLARPDGTVLCDDPFTADGTINDPRFGGLGCFGMHVARRNGEADPVNYCWDVTGRHHAATRYGFGVGDGEVLRLEPGSFAGGAAVFLDIGVPFYDGEAWAAGEPLAEARYEWVFLASRAQATITVTTLLGAAQGSPAFVKEPKLVAHSLGPPAEGSPRYRWLDLFDRAGALLQHFDIWSLPDPSIDTKQWPQDGRVRARFDDPERGHLYLNVVAEALRANNEREPWEGSEHGLDAWAVLSNGREALEPCEGDEAYCLQGPSSTLTRQWETARWASAGAGSPPEPGRPQTGIMLHGWEGGSGYPDCRCAFRRFGPPGEVFRSWLCLSYDAGWVV
jgi:hypothetical protein